MPESKRIQARRIQAYSIQAESIIARPGGEPAWNPDMLSVMTEGVNVFWADPLTSSFTDADGEVPAGFSDLIQRYDNQTEVGSSANFSQATSGSRPNLVAPGYIKAPSGTGLRTLRRSAGAGNTLTGATIAAFMYGEGNLQAQSGLESRIFIDSGADRRLRVRRGGSSTASSSNFFFDLDTPLAVIVTMDSSGVKVYRDGEDVTTTLFDPPPVVEERAFGTSQTVVRAGEPGFLGRAFMGAVKLSDPDDISNLNKWLKGEL